MSRARKWAVAITLVVFAIAAGVCGWLLSRYDPDTASKYAGVIQAVAAVFGLCGVVFAVMALASGPGADKHVQKNHGDQVFSVQNGTMHINGNVLSPTAGADAKGLPDDQSGS